MWGLGNAADAVALKPDFFIRIPKNKNAGLVCPARSLSFICGERLVTSQSPRISFFEISTALTIRLQNSILFKDFGLAVTAT